ncbi:MAG: DUF1846 family protein, partial [Clostridia bacterium]|nr:DUF1846 family protein [Clostridia bacterium]
NMAGFCIVDDENCKQASKDELIRRYYTALCEARTGRINKEVVSKIELLMRKLGLAPENRAVVLPALQKAADTGAPAAAIELPDGRIVTGKTGKLLGAASAALLNALKALGGIHDKIELISPNVIEPLQKLKVHHLGAANPRLHTDEVLMALSICAVTNPTAKFALEELDKLKNCEIHSTVILSTVDEKLFKSLGMRVTCEPQRTPVTH